MLFQVNRYNHAKQIKRKRGVLKTLKTVVGLVYRDLERQLPKQPIDVQLDIQLELDTTRRILGHKRDD